MKSLTCTSCHHANRADRGFCGRCGTMLQLVCRGCRFVNEHVDSYCGGCGGPLAVASATARGPSAPISKSGELTDLFAAPAETAAVETLPAAGITQDDLDRLFNGGGAS